MKTKMYGKKVWMLAAMILITISLMALGGFAVFAEQTPGGVSPEVQDNQILLGEPYTNLENSEDVQLKTQAASRYVNIPAEFDYDSARIMHAAINRERQKAGKEPLHVNKEAVEFAMERAVESQILFYLHFSPRGYIRVSRDNTLDSENAGIGRYEESTIEKRQEGFVESSEHYANMLESYHKAMGVGYVKIGNLGTAVQIFENDAQTGDDPIPSGKIYHEVPVYFEPSFCNIHTCFTKANGVKIQSIGLKKGETQTIQLRAYATMGDSDTNVSWEYTPTKASFSSSNPSVARVDANGNVIGVSHGTAMITATTGTESNTIQVTVADNAESVEYLDHMTYVLLYPGLNVDKQQFDLNAGASRSFRFDGDETHKASYITVKWTGSQTEITSSENCNYSTTETFYDSFAPYQNIFVYPDVKQAEPTPSSNESITYTFVCEQTGISQNVVCQDGKTATYAFEGNDDYGPFSCTMKWENKSSSFAKINDCLVSTDGAKLVNGRYVQTIKLTPKTIKTGPADFRVRVAYPKAVNKTYSLKVGENKKISMAATNDYEALSFNLSWNGKNYSIANKSKCTVKVSGNKTKGFDVVVAPVAKPKKNPVKYTVSYTGINQKDTKTCAVGKSVKFSVSNNADYQDLSFTLTWDGKNTKVSNRKNCTVTVGKLSNGNQGITVKPTAPKDKSVTYKVVYQQLGQTKTTSCAVGKKREFKTAASNKYEASAFTIGWNGTKTTIYKTSNCSVALGRVSTVNGKRQQNITVTLKAKSGSVTKNPVKYTVSYTGINQKDTKTCAVGKSVKFSVSNNADYQDLSFTLSWDGKNTKVSNRKNCTVSVGKLSNGNQGITVKPTAPKDKSVTYKVVYQQLGQTKTTSCAVGKKREFKTAASNKYEASAFTIGWNGTKTTIYKTSNCSVALGKVSTVNGKRQQNVTVTLKAKSGQSSGSGAKVQQVAYRTHVQNVGWQPYVTNAMMSGTSGKSLRLEGMNIKLFNQKYKGDIEYRTHIENIGWESTWRKNNKFSGTSGKSLRLEAMQVRLTGQMADHYDVYYRVHAQNFGWLNWAKNGEPAGTEGYAYRLECMQIMLVDKGKGAPFLAPWGNQNEAYKKNNDPNFYIPNSCSDQVIDYTTHVQNVGWQPYMTNGMMAGTSGQSLRLEGIRVKLTNPKYSGSILYRTHIQNIGWENGYRSGGSMSGTSGRSLRLEAIQIALTGEISKHYDVYYRVHAQNFGWLGWAKNGQSAGTAGYAYRLEGIQIVLVKKGQDIYKLNPDKPRVAAFFSQK